MYFKIRDINSRASSNSREYCISGIDSENIIEKRETSNERIIEESSKKLEKSGRPGTISWSIIGREGRRWWSVVTAIVAIVTRKVEEFGCYTSSIGVSVTRERKTGGRGQERGENDARVIQDAAKHRGGMKKRQE